MSIKIYPQVLICLAFILLLAPNRACALEKEIFAQRELISIVLKHHPLLKASEEEIKQSQAELLGAEGAFDPVLKGEVNSFMAGGYSGSYESLGVEQPLQMQGSKLVAGYRRSGGEFPVYDDYFNTNSSGEIRAGIEVPLLRDRSIDRRRAAIARASIQIGLMNLTFEQRKLEVLRQALLSYWNWVTAYQKLEAFKLLLEKAEIRDRQIAQRVKSGDLAHFDKIDNERQVLQRRANLIAAERLLTLSRYDLELFLWDEGGVSLSLEGRKAPRSREVPLSPRGSLDEAVRIALSTRIEHRRIKGQIEQQDIELAHANNQILPRLDVATFAANDFGSGSSDRAESDLRAIIRLEVPLMTRTQRGKIYELEAKQRASKMQLSFWEKKIVNEVKDAHNSLTLALSRVALARDELRVSQELEKGEGARFNEGESNLIFVNLREQATVDAHIREIEALADCWKSRIVLETAQGRISGA